MFSRGWFLQTASALLAFAGSASAEENTRPLLDLNLFDQSAAADHARAFDATLRCVNHEVFGDPAGVVIEDTTFNGAEDAGYSGSGSYPDGWQVLPTAPTGFAAAFSKTGVGNGRLRLQGGSAGDFYVVIGSSRHFAVATGDLLTGSVAIRLADGERSSLTSLGLLVFDNDADGAPANHAPPVTPRPPAFYGIDAGNGGWISQHTFEIQHRILDHSETRTWALTFDGNKVDVRYEDTDGAKVDLHGEKSSN
jgi:hypothetical protein